MPFFSPMRHRKGLTPYAWILLGFSLLLAIGLLLLLWGLMTPTPPGAVPMGPFSTARLRGPWHCAEF